MRSGMLLPAAASYSKSRVRVALQPPACLPALHARATLCNPPAPDRSFPTPSLQSITPAHHQPPTTTHTWPLIRATATTLTSECPYGTARVGCPGHRYEADVARPDPLAAWVDWCHAHMTYMLISELNHLKPQHRRHSSSTGFCCHWPPACRIRHPAAALEESMFLSLPLLLRTTCRQTAQAAGWSTARCVAASC